MYTWTPDRGRTLPLGRWLICAASIVALVSTAMTSIASAGSYEIDNCPAAPIPNGNPGPWTIFGAPQSYKDSCSGGPGDFIGPLGGLMAPATTDGVQVAAPAGSAITISQVEVWWYVPHQISGADTFAQALATNGLIAQSTTPDNKSVSPDDFVLPSATTSFTLLDYCSNDDAGGGCAFGEENPDLELFGAQLTLSDSSLPSATATGGGLAGSGPLSGTAGIAYDAQDGDSGVRSVQLLLDGQPVAEHDYLAQCPYQDFAACPTSLSGELQWNTAQAANGPHEVALRVISAGENALIVDDHVVTIDNPATLSPMHVPNGDPCGDEQLSVEVDGKHSAPVVPYGRSVTVEGLLHCGATPISNARIVVDSLGGASNDSITGSVQTETNGSFVFDVRAGPDRRLQFSYTPYSDSPHPSAVATTATAVRPSISLQISPRNTSNGHTIHWKGRIVGGPYPREGVTFDVEVQEGRRWRIFDQLVTRNNGRFRYSYRFHATTEPTTYRFRVVLPDTGSAGYSYRPGASNVVAVHVAP